MDHHCSLVCRSPCVCAQGGPGRSRAFWDIYFAPGSPYLVRNDTNLTPTSTPVLLKCSPRAVFSTRQNGRISELEMLSGSRTTTLSRQMSFFSVRVNPKAFATSKPPILTGAHGTGLISIQRVA